MSGLKKAFLCILFVCSSIAVSAQDWVRINELTYDAEYFFMSRQYDKAIKAYSQIMKELPDNANIIYKLGVCYLLTETEKEKSIPFFIEASKNINKYYKPDSYKEFGAPLETYFLLGSAYRVSNQLDKAIEAYKDYLVNIDPKNTKEIEITEHYIKACGNAKQMMENPVSLALTNIGPPVNDELPNFNAVFSADGNTVVYNTSKKDQYNILISVKTNGVWSKPKVITKQLTSKTNFRITGISSDGTILLLVEDDPFNSEIYISKFNKGRWTSAEKFKKPINSKMNETHASLSPDGKTMYFTSDRGGGMGDLDIYFSKMDTKGKWGKPENIGSKINTIFNEETPFISPDGNRLYFSSEGHDGMGGYDIFYLNLFETGSNPVNIGYPINTTDNDLFFYPGSTINNGYFSLKEKNESGSRDIYYVEIQQLVELKGKVIPDNSPYYVDTGLFAISLVDLNDYSTVAELKPQHVNGEFSRKIPSGKYMISVNAPGYENFSQEITIDKENSKPEYIVEAKMTSIQEEPVNEEIVAAVEEPSEVLIPEITPVNSQVKEVIPAAVEAVPEIIAEPEKETIIITEEKAEPVLTTPVTLMEEKPASVKKNPVIYLNPVSAFADEVVNELNDVSSIPQGTPVTYTVQLFALKKPVDLNYFTNIDNLSVQYTPDKYFKYTWGLANTLQEARKLRDYMKEMGYCDIIIRRRAIVPAYTIQVSAGRNNLDFGYFNKFDKLRVTLGKDGYYRYTYGEYQNMEEAQKELVKLKGKGYRDIFVKKIRNN